MQRRDWLGLAFVAACTVGLIGYRAVYIEPRAWGAACAAAQAPAACLPRAGLIWLQHYYLWGAGSLALGLWAFFGAGGYAAQLLAIALGIAAVENYNATWGGIGAALGAWCWLSRNRQGAASTSAQAFQASD